MTMQKLAQVTLQKFDDEQMIAYAPVYVPFKADTQGDWMAPREIEKIAHGFNAAGRSDRVDTNHDLRPSGAKVVESYISKQGDPLFPVPGTWGVGIKYTPAQWPLVKSGELRGLSMYGQGRRIEKGLPNQPDAKHELVDGEIFWVSTVKSPATKEFFVMAKSTDLTQTLANIINGLDGAAKRLDAIAAHMDEQDAKIAALPTLIPEVPSFGVSKSVRKAAPAPRQDPEVIRLLRRRDRLNDRLASIWERPDMYEPDAEREVSKSLQRVEDDLYAHGHEDQRTGIDSNSVFYSRGGSSNFLQATPSSFAEILGPGASRGNSVSKSDELTEADIPVENCLVL